MSYQVLARKWRPKRFAELVGQEHVVRALSHALDSGRIHHAFLFTGTRGVGKTTIARIFAKSLNCEKGVGSNPCGECGACRDVDAGRFMDLLEIDAASNTGVDDVRVLIENAQYTPARGQYKVYLIDEVHMLSKNAFNALLKTLEEPPPHAKFLLATTDPQKLPVTVLSRCLQFNLKRLSDEQIAGQVERILAAEDIVHDTGSVFEIARGGNGSLRDALSLLDQAIAFGGGALRDADVRTMLGTIDRNKVAQLLDAVVAGDAAALMQGVAEVAEFAPDFGTVLDELSQLLHRIQLEQFVPGSAAQDPAHGAAAERLSTALAPEEVQLLYQLTVTGRRDLALAPSPRTGFEMTLLRLLAFKPGDGSPLPASDTRVNTAAATPARRGAAAPVAPTSASEARAARPPPAPVLPPTSAATVPAAVPKTPATRATAVPQSAPVPAVAGPSDKSTALSEQPSNLDADRWHGLLNDLALRGPLRELAHNAVMLGYANGVLRLGLTATHEHFRTDGLARQLADALKPVLGMNLKLQFEAVSATSDSVAERQRRDQSQRQSNAESLIAEDPAVQDLLAQFGGRVVPNSTRPSKP